CAKPSILGLARPLDSW
nr:immunoglobulin heavy chain junction region [Macaca mulatta]MOV40618.1 immunoglobulin heavy chain junction region [Macaca mulatta]MOV41242.1 immunoglobulin heavy chain junction region [Macaca mulatta]MOV42007.1 immunoglobulin heavy chain junction region [Macaca mulatta]MOV46843.1 immunoglobulin heavy chain junction region [Macaca mulatta]